MSSRSEDMLTAIVDGAAVDSEPLCRKEKYLKAIANNDPSDLPNPMCREEELLLQIAEKGIGGGDNPIITEDVTVTPKESQQTIKRSAGKFINQVTVEAIPDEYVVPEGTINITENGPYDVKNYESATINVLSEDPALQEKTVIQNGEVTPDEGYDGLSKVIVDVPVEEPTLQEKTTTVNGDIVPDDGYDGLSKVVVNVPIEEPVLQEKTTTVNGEVVADSGYDGLSKVIVNVPVEEPDLTTKEITVNGTYKASDDNADGFSSVTVNVPEKEPVLQEKTATANGDIVPDTGFDGLSKVVVNVAGSGVSSLTSKTVLSNGLYNASDEGFDGFSNVHVSVLSVDGVPFRANIPAEFPDGHTIYYFRINDDRVLISGSDANTGLWLYTVSTNTWKQVYSEGWYSVFQIVDDKCLIGQNQSSNQVMLVYSLIQDAILCVSEPTAGRNSIEQVGDYWFCCASTYGGGLDVYDPEHNTITRIIDDGYKWSYITMFNGKYIISSTSSSFGVWVFDPETNTATKLLTTGNLNKVTPLNDTVAIITSASSSGGKGAYAYHIDTNTCVQIISTGYGYTTYEQVSDTRWLCTNKTGLYLYDSTDDTFIQPYTSNSGWSVCCRKDGVAFISNPSSSNGLLLYDDAMKTVTKIYDSGSNWSYVYDVGDKYLITASGNNGLLSYDRGTKEISVLWSTGSYRYSQFIGEVLLLGASGTNPLLMYDTVTSTISAVYGEDAPSTTRCYDAFAITNGNCLIGSSLYSMPILLYDSTTKTVTEVSDKAGPFNTFEPLDNGDYLIGSTSTSGTGVWLYDSSTKTTTQLYSSSTAWCLYHKLIDGYLISSTGTSDLLFYNNTDKTVTRVGSLSGPGYRVIYDDDVSCIFSSDAAYNGLVVYDIATKTILEKTFTTGNKYSIVEENELGALIYADPDANNYFIVQYNKTDRTFKIVAYDFI